MATLRRIVHLIFRPTAEWVRIAGEKTSTWALLRGYILPLALLAPIATVIGMSVFDRDWDPTHGYLVRSEHVLAAGAATFSAIVGSIFALAAIFACIAPMFGGNRDFLGALKVTTYGSVPVMLAGATLVMPVMALIGLVGLFHTLVLFWIGARSVLNVPASEGAEFIGISLVLLTLISIIAGAIGGASGLLR
jgi:hypothetical protein